MPVTGQLPEEGDPVREEDTLTKMGGSATEEDTAKGEEGALSEEGSATDESGSDIDLSPEDEAALRSEIESLSPKEQNEILQREPSNTGADNFRFRVEDSPELRAGYDPSTGYYSYTFPNGSGFSMTAPLGSISDKPVTVRTDGEAVIARYCQNNVRLVAPDEEKDIVGFTAEESGGYDFTVESETHSGPLWESYTSRISFRVEREGITAGISYVSAPYGFEIGEIYLNGERRETADKERTVLSEDGDYTLVFYPVKVQGAGSYSFSFRRDTTAPQMIFSEDIFAGEIEGTIYFQPSEEDAKVTIYRNGLKLNAVPDGISLGGSYYLEVSDPLGNSRGYRFDVKQKRNTPFSFYGMYLGGILLIFLVIVFISKRNLRVL